MASEIVTRTEDTITTEDNGCEIFALCGNEPEMLIEHPAGPVAGCQRCVDKLTKLNDGIPPVIIATRNY